MHTVLSYTQAFALLLVEHSTEIYMSTVAKELRDVERLYPSYVSISPVASRRDCNLQPYFRAVATELGLIAARAALATKKRAAA